jgi:hypothetical protein
MSTPHRLLLVCLTLLSPVVSGTATAKEKKGAVAKPAPAGGEAAKPAPVAGGEAAKPTPAGGEAAKPTPAGGEAAKPAEGSPVAAESDEEEAPPGAPSGYRLPGGIHLGGMFDIAYERTDRSGDFTSGKNALRSYHRLLFLSRQGDDFPIGFSAELLGQYFYEANARLSKPGSRLRVLVHGGKILVPFGPDPLFHKSYGGLTGVDQRTLPVVWSALGAGVRFSYAWGKLSVADEVYAVHGFDLPAANQTLNMQRDLAAYDGTRIAVGNRLSLARGPLTLWYSLYWNPMRFGRSLVMQAVDLAVWRPPLPVLSRFALGAGFVRAQVSPTDQWGQPGASLDDSAYGHFADYLWLRGYLADGLYLRAMTGLATFGNLSGFTYDERRADASDGSHHSLALVFEYASLQTLLAYYWNFEKVDERPDDLFRLMVTYAF